MPTYLSPGVYVEEIEAGSRPIEGVGTAVAAFVGLAGSGPFNAPTLVTNWSQFTGTFGEFVEGSYLAPRRVRVLPERWRNLLRGPHRRQRRGIPGSSRRVDHEHRRPGSGAAAVWAPSGSRPCRRGRGQRHHGGDRRQPAPRERPRTPSS